MSDLSIVVQGGLSRENLVATAVRCRHWRELFPQAEIILSLSSTDVVQGALQDGILTNMRVVPSLRCDTTMVAALDAINESCDLVALRTDGLPLPPIKADADKPNNINLQIAAAQNGLRHAKRSFVLRVRSDLVFLDDSFIDQWMASAALPRGDRASLSQRVMISWLYTLNPFTLERFPLHFSDWFHFGRIEDVRALWDVPFVSFADSVYFRVNPHPNGTSFGERLFYIRIAVEQHLILNAMRKYIPTLKIDAVSDRSSVDLALDILADDFCLCDLLTAKCVFEKYQFEFRNPQKTIHCLTPDDWRLMVAHRGVNYRTTLGNKIRQMHDRRSYERDDAFPRTYSASRLFTKQGCHINGAIAATERSGTLVFGPHISIPAGRYRAQLEIATLEGPGVLVLKATLGHGSETLAERRIGIATDAPSDIDLDFDVTQPDAADFEIIVEMENLRDVAVTGVTIVDRANSLQSLRSPDHAASIPPAQIISSDEARHCVDGAGNAWRVVASVESLRLGRYSASLNVAAVTGVGTVFVRASAADGSQVLSEQAHLIDPDVRLDASLRFNIESSEIHSVHIECRASGVSEFKVRGATVIECSPNDSSAAYPRFFRASDLRTLAGAIENDEIVFTAKSGTVSYGPYISLPPGQYVATLLVSRVAGRGWLTMAITASPASTQHAFSSARFSPRSNRRPRLAFCIPEEGATEVEVVCSARGLREIALIGVVIDKLS